MKEQNRYTFEEAVKNFYTTEPLKIDLSKTVTNNLFSRRKKASLIPDNWLYFFAAFLIAAGVIFSFSFLSKASLLPVFILMIAIAVYFILSFKEYTVMSKKILSSL